MSIIGEYIGTIHTLVQKRQLVVEQQRINFEYSMGKPLWYPLQDRSENSAAQLRATS